MHRINIIISSTPTLVGKGIRFVTKEDYNHVSFCLDDDFDCLYSFSRRYRRNILSGCFTKENISSLTGDKSISVSVHSIDISDEKFADICEFISELESHAYVVYNYIALFLLIFDKGFATKRSFVCSTFAGYILTELIGVSFDKPFYLLKPMDLYYRLEEFKTYEGSIVSTSYRLTNDSFLKTFTNNTYKL